MTVAEFFAKLTLKVDDTSWKKGEAAITGLKGLLAGIGLSAAAARGAIEALISHTATAARESEKAAQRVGMARERFQELDEAAKHSGVDSFEQSIKFLNRALYEAQHGSKEARREFRDLGVEVSKSTKVGDVFPKLVDAFGRLSDDDPKKIALALKFFGRSGNEMLPFLAKGNEGIAEMIEHAHKLGLIFSGEDYDAAKKYKRANLELKMSLEGLERTIGKGLLKEAGGIARAMAEWVAENREWIATGIHNAVALATSAWKRATATLEPLIKAAKWLASQTWIWKAALVALSLVLVAQFGHAVRDAVHGGAKLLGVLRAITFSQVLGAAASLAWGLAWAAGIALALGAIEELYGWITGDRETLLEEWLGSFADMKKGIATWFDVSDSPLARMARDIAASFETAREAVRDVKRLLGMNVAKHDQGSWDAAVMPKAFEAAGATGMQSQWELAKDPRFTALARAGKFAEIASEFSGRSFAPAGAAGAAPSVTFGDIIVQGGANATPEDLAAQFGAVVDAKLRAILDPAYEAVQR